MQERTLEEVLLLGVKAIEQEHAANYCALQNKLEDYTVMCGAFFDYLFESNGIDAFLVWARKNIKSESSISTLSDYIRDLSGDRS